METNVFKGLMKKEWLLIKNSFMFLLFAMLFVWLIALGWSVFTGNANVLLLFTIMIIAVHVLYVTWIVGAGLNMEDKSQLWLHNPNSTSTLLGSKLMTAMYLQGISLLVALLLLTVTINLSAMEMIGEFELEVMNIDTVVSAVVQVMITGLELGLYYMFFWTIYHVMGKYHFVLKFRVVLFIFLIVLFFMVINFMESHLLTGLETVLPFPIEMAKFMNVYMEEEGLGVRSSGENITLAGLIISLLKAAGLFSLSSLLLNKVVEVK